MRYIHGRGMRHRFRGRKQDPVTAFPPCLSDRIGLCGILGIRIDRTKDCNIGFRPAPPTRRRRVVDLDDLIKNDLTRFHP